MQNKTPPSNVDRPAPPEAALAILDVPSPTHVLSRKVVPTVDGRRYQLLIATPRITPPDSGFPVLYLLDGNAAFDTLTPERLAAAPDLVLVGVGYETPFRFDRAARSLDYTPDASGKGPHADPASPERLVGGAAAFLQRLRGDIRAHAEDGIPTDPLRRTLWGHSLGGLFTLHTLLTDPAAFSRYAAASPSVWWGDEMLLRLEGRLPANGADADVLIMLGDSERRSSASGPHWDGPAPHTLEMIRRLSARDQLRVSSQVFPGSGHAATLAISLPYAFSFARRESTS